MSEHIHDRLPFYINGTLPGEQAGAVAAHLQACQECRAALAGWEELASAIRPAEPGGRAETFPALSPVVRQNPGGRPAFSQAVLSAARLIAAQRIFLKDSCLVPAVSAMLLAGALPARLLPAGNPRLAVAPLFGLAPFLAALGVCFVEMRAGGLGSEMAGAAPTRPGALAFARVALVLGLVAGLALLASLAVALGAQISLLQVVIAWLGPAFWLAALAALLALLAGPWVAAGAAFSLWGGMLLFLAAEGQGRPLLGFSLAPLLAPGPWLFGAQALAAGVLWLAAGLAASRRAAPAPRPEGTEIAFLS